MKMLCELAHSLPPRIAELLERDRGLKRNFREETVTDLLMASLVGLEAFGIRVDFPDEPTTGGDMDWIFAAPLEIHGGRYLRLILQAKRAHFAKLKVGGYWYYHHLDHGKPAGQQAQTLVGYTGRSPAGMATLPLYILYHPISALTPATSNRPAIDGINLVFAHHVAPVVLGGCKKKQKKVDHWRDHFMPLSDILCWPAGITARGDPAASDATQFMIGPFQDVLPVITGAFHPDLVARRFRHRQEQISAPPAAQFVIEPADGIPPSIQRAIEGQVTAKDRRELKRPRVILTTSLSRTDRYFGRADELSRR
ncbi:hypothetical protein M1D34_31825 (plasmid) [Ensifer sp. D2-11]